MKDFFKFAKISELCGGESAAVFGAGTSGKAAKALLEKAGMEVVVYDKNGGGSCEKIFDESSAKKHRLAVYSPAFRPDHEWVQLAEKAGISIATITKMGKDGAVVSSDVLVKICSALGCTMDDIVEIVDMEEKI